MLQSLRRNLRRKRRVSLPVITLLTFISLTTFLWVTTIFWESPHIHHFATARLIIFGNEIQCYRDHTLKTLTDIEDLTPPDLGKSIFFHETSCHSYNNHKITITWRQACAVESAALLHPERKIYLLFTSPGLLKLKPEDNSESSLALTALQSYNNIYLGHIDFDKYLNNTSLEHLYTSYSIELSYYARSHASDVLRYLTLWKYGGIYLDLDVVITKSFNDLGGNFAGFESNESIAAGVLGLSNIGQGHIWASRCLKDLSKNFSGSNWGHNGPGVITRVLKKVCTNTSYCEGFKAMPPKAFYPIPWRQWEKYFDPDLTNSTLDLVKDSYAIHVWNKHSYSKHVSINSAYAKIAKQFCPKVYKKLEKSIIF